VLSATVEAFNAAGSDWEAYDVSEDYGKPRPIYAERGSDYFADVSAIYELGALVDLANLDSHVRDIDYYFCEFHDDEGRRIVGVKKATQFKTTLAARNKLVRVVNDTLRLIEESVLKVDPLFDALITEDYVFILNPRPLEYIANLVEHVAGAAEAKVQFVHEKIPFLDLTRIRGRIGKHPQMARIAASIASRADLSDFRRDRIEALAAQHGIVFKEVDGRLRCRVVDEAKLLEILDARRYHLDLADDGGIPYRAPARQRVIP
jgi:hypothetical protein